MDEIAYHATRQARVAQACVFARAILSTCAQCELARKHALAEREVLECGSPVAHTNCVTLDGLLHERARFALRLPRKGEPLAHAQAMKLQCGGLRGLHQAMQTPTPDVNQMVQVAMREGHSLLDLPWSNIVTSVTAWQLRKRSTQTPPAGS